jgi:hypothetical protein
MKCIIKRRKEIKMTLMIEKGKASELILRNNLRV